VGDDHVEFDLFKASKLPSISNECHRIDVIDSLVRETIINYDSIDPLEHCILDDSITKDENLKWHCVLNFLKPFHKCHISLFKEEALIIDDKP